MTCIEGARTNKPRSCGTGKVMGWRGEERSGKKEEEADGTGLGVVEVVEMTEHGVKRKRARAYMWNCDHEDSVLVGVLVLERGARMGEGGGRGRAEGG